MKIIEKILDIETGEENIIEREETADEKKARLDFEAEKIAENQANAEKEAARQAVLAKLGLTAEEAAALLA